MKTVACLCAFLLVAFGGGAFADWENIQVIDNAGDAGTEPSVAVDQDGTPHTVYYKYNALYYAHWTDSGWLLEQLAASGWESARIVSLADGTLVICYVDASDNRLKLRYRRPAGSWTTTGSTYNASRYFGDGLAAVATGTKVHVAAIYESERLLYFVTDFDAGVVTWTVDGEIAEGLDGDKRNCSLAIDGGGRPHVSYWDGDSRDLVYAWHDGGTWYSQFVDGDGADVGEANSIVLRGNETHLFYYDETNGALKHATIVRE